MSDLNEVMLTKFKCSRYAVCRKYVHPPIQLCVVGHSMCWECSTKIRHCPRCQRPLCDRRCFLIEKVHDSLTFPCKYKDLGCSVMTKGSNIVAHENICEAYLKSCPLKSLDGCPWRGRVDQIEYHCRFSHPENIHDESGKLVWTIRESPKVLHLVFAHHQLFLVTAHFDVKTDSTSWGIYVLGSEKYANEFEYDVDVKDAANPMRGLSVDAVCNVISHDDASSFKQSNCFHWPCTMLEQHCGRKIIIFVRIYRR